MKKLALLLMCLMPLMISGCQMTQTQPSLYVQLGEMEGIQSLVESFINQVIFDKRTAKQFEDSDLDRFHDKLVEQICQLSGGPCRYSGKKMQPLHENMAIDEAQFNAVVEAMVSAMEENHISTGAQNRLLAVLAPMRKDIVTK